MKDLSEIEKLMDNAIVRLEKLLPIGGVSESIFSGKSNIIPMADVQHIEKHWYKSDERTKDNYRGVLVITKHTKWNTEIDNWENNIYLDREQADKFIKAWCIYRHELENLKPLNQ